MNEPVNAPESGPVMRAEADPTVSGASSGESAKVAVISAYHKEPASDLLRCIQSVQAQHYRCTHFLISDGHPHPVVEALADSLPLRHVRLGKEHGDFGDTPRAVGSMLAIREGFDAIIYLDVDNWLLPEHVANLVQAWLKHGKAFDVITTRRFFTRPDGSRLPIEDDEPYHQHTDTSCFFLTGEALAVTPVWALMPRRLSVIGDRIFWWALRARGLKIAHLPEKTVAYTSLWKSHYLTIGEPSPPGAKDIMPEIRDAVAWWRALPQADKAGYNRFVGFDLDGMLAAT